MSRKSSEWHWDARHEDKPAKQASAKRDAAEAGSTRVERGLIELGNRSADGSNREKSHSWHIRIQQLRKKIIGGSRMNEVAP